MAINTNLEPRSDAKGRKSGDAMTPEGASPRPGPSGRRSGAISGAPLEPEATKPRASGNAMDNTQDSNVVAPVINGPSGSADLDIPKL